MKINLENAYLVPSINFLQSIKLKGKESRSRSKLVKLLTESLAELQEDEQQLLNEYGVTNADGDLVKNAQGNIEIQPGRDQEWNKAHRELMEEVAEVEGGTYVNHINDCHDILDGYDGELSGQEAEAYDALLDAFENSEKEGK